MLLQSQQVTPACINRTEYLANGSQYMLQQKLSPGNYSLKVRAQTQAGYGSFSPLVYFYIEETSTGTGTQFAIIGSVVVLVSKRVLYYSVYHVLFCRF